MSTSVLAWGSIALYVAVTAVLAYRGYRKTKSLESYAVGAGDIAPWVVGLSLSAQLTSVATFVVNPGLVFAYGTAGFLGFGLAAGLGIILGLVVFSHAFRKLGLRVAALSVPGWIGKRYDSRALQVGFGVVSLALVTYAVLIVVAIAHMLHLLLGVDATGIALAVIVFVFGYVMLGGVNTHAYTNAIQAIIMLIVAVLLVGSGLPLLWQGEGLFARLGALDPALVAWTNPGSLYFRNLFEVFVCNFVVGLALVCQPHILSKALYLKKDSDVTRYLVVGLGTGLLFLLVMSVGLFARLELPASVRIDQVVPTYVVSHFTPGLTVLITIGILCAGISTLEGILLGLTTIVSTDLYLTLFGRRLQALDKDARGHRALRVGRWSYLVLGLVTFALSRWQIVDPVGGSVAIFAQYGVYLLITASIVPLAAGMFLPGARRHAVVSGTVVALASFALSALAGFTAMHNNPAFLATVGILSGSVVFGLLQWAVPARAVAGQAQPSVL
jgi:Na+/proline symporter